MGNTFIYKICLAFLCVGTTKNVNELLCDAYSQVLTAK